MRGAYGPGTGFQVTAAPLAHEPEEEQGQPDPQPLDAARLLRELAQRWRAASTLEYRSEAILNHAGEFRVAVRIHACLQRPNRARLLFLADNPEVSQVRVSTGGRIWWRGASTRLRPGKTNSAPFQRRLTDGIAHPLDETAYSVDQFFAPVPFWPPASWGSGTSALHLEAVRLRRNPEEKGGKRGDTFRIRITRGPSRDTLLLDAASLSPLLLVRVGDHAGQVQELLRERFFQVRLGAPLSPALFRWTEQDEAGVTLR